MMSELASDFVARARYTVRQARQSFDEQEWAVCIERCEEAVELAIKSTVLAVGQQYGKDHRVHDLERPEVYGLYPLWFQALAPRLTVLSEVFAHIRKPAKYGVESLGAPPSVLFRPYEAETYLRNAEEVVDVCERLVLEISAS